VNFPAQKRQYLPNPNATAGTPPIVPFGGILVPFPLEATDSSAMIVAKLRDMRNVFDVRLIAVAASI
jgi:hypothetical protein